MNTDIIIQTQRLTIVPMEERFLDSLCEYALDPSNARMMVYLPYESREEAKSFIQNARREWEKDMPDVCEFAVLLKGRHIGGVTMYFEGDCSRGELGWIINREWWGSGYAPEAARGLMDFFRREMGLTRFIAHCDSENQASRRVMDKLGMRLVEIHPGRVNRLGGGERQECLYEIFI